MSNSFRVITWILHESEAFIGKALKGEAIVLYANPLITQQMKASGLARRVKIIEINWLTKADEISSSHGLILKKKSRFSLKFAFISINLPKNILKLT
jgi:hypothetical protein